MDECHGSIASVHNRIPTSATKSFQGRLNPPYINQGSTLVVFAIGQ